MKQEQQQSTAVVSSASAGALLMDGNAMDRIERIADIMASGKTTVPQHLRGSKGDCFAVCLQSMQWGMNPFAVAQKTHLVNGTLGYEAQLVAAVINSSGAVKDRFAFEFYGPWEKVIGKFSVKKGEKGEYRVPGWTFADEEGCGVRVSATLKGEAMPRVLDLLLAQARVRNSTLWADDPKQQLAYLAEKKWSRLYAPDVILGVYTADELAEPEEKYMGAAEVVEPERPQWPADKWAETLPKIVAGIRKGKSIDDALAWLRAKAIVTPAQEAELRAEVEAIPSGVVIDQATSEEQAEAPEIDFAKLLAAIKAAKNEDELSEHAALIGAVKDEAQRLRLSEAFQTKARELNGD